MKMIPNDLSNYISFIHRVDYLREQIMLYTKDGIYAYIPVPSSKEIYSYLEEIGFKDYYSLINSYHDSFQLFQLDGSKNSNRLFLLEDYYEKSSHVILFDSKKVQNIYQKVLKNFHQQYQFYFDIQNKIEEMYYPRKPFYNLLLQISSVYHLLSLGEFFLNEWYQLHPTEYREVLTLRKIESTNFWDDKIINVASSRRDYYVFELANYYRMYYDQDIILEELHDFFHRFPTTQEDALLFYALISSVNEFDLETFESEKNILLYVSKTYSFVSEKYKKYQENKEKMFEEK